MGHPKFLLDTNKYSESLQSRLNYELKFRANGLQKTQLEGSYKGVKRKEIKSDIK